MLGLPAFRKNTEKSATQEKQCRDFIASLSKNRGTLEKYQNSGKTAKSIAYIKGLASGCGIELTEKQMHNARELNLKIDDLLNTHLPPINPIYSVPLRMALSYVFSYYAPTAITSAAGVNLITKDVIGAIIGKKHKEVNNIASILVMLLNFFVEPSPASLLNKTLPALEEHYGAGAYLIAPAFTLCYQVGSPYLVSGIKKSTGMLSDLLETAREFCDVIHGQGSYYDEQDSMPSSSYKM